MKRGMNMKNGKRFLSVLLVVVIVLAAVPVAYADDNIASGNMGSVYWSLNYDTGVLSISGSGKIPDLYWKNCPWGWQNSSIKKVTIRDGITAIGSNCFDGLSNLTQVSISDTVTEIRHEAFSGCGAIERISLPDSIQSIEESAFVGCGLLSTINIPENVTKISKNVFRGCTSLTEIKLADGVTSIEEQAFYGCSRLKTVQFSENLQVIGNMAFAECIKLESANLPEKLIKIGDYAFSNCESLQSITFPNSLSIISESAFFNCKSLENVLVPKNVLSIGKSAFNACENLTTAVFPNSLTELSAGCLSGCNIQSFAIPNTVLYLEDGVFMDCTNLREIMIPKSVISIGTGCFGVCTRLKHVYYEGTEEEWARITISNKNNYYFDNTDNSCLLSAEIHFNSDTSNWYPHDHNIYNLGEETYSFPNYGDTDSDGHCFGMSMTSAGYYNNLLGMNVIGDSSTLFDYEDNATVRVPICYYQARQGSRAVAAIVAGGSYYKTQSYDIDADWTAVINYVKNHASDDKGILQIGYRGRTRDSNGNIVSGGHAINFLRYEVVNGEERIYAYDNNFPNEETYFYKDRSGSVRQAPHATFDISIRSIALRNVATYFSLVGGFDLSHVVYADAEKIAIDGLTPYYMDGNVQMDEHVMYELPDNTTTIKIIPLSDDATFTYLGKTYSFGEIDDDTYGILTLSETEDGTGSLVIENAPETNPDTPDTHSNPQPENGCKWCGKTHTGFFGGIVGFFHRIFAAIFGARH